MVEKRREALETKVERWKWALERVYLTRVLTRIVRLVAAASRSRSPSPRKAFSKVLPTLCTAAFLNGVLLRRRINAIIVDRSFSGTWPGGKRGGENGEEDDGGEGGGGCEYVASLSNSRTGKLEISIREGTKGCGDERGGSLRRFIAAFFFFFWKGVGGVSEEGWKYLYCVFGNEKLSYCSINYFRSTLDGFYQ